MSTLADYKDRIIDVMAFQGVASSGDVKLRQALADEQEPSGTITTGIQKLAQRFVLELLTVQGSIPHMPTRGSTLITDIRLGVIQTELDVFEAFAVAQETARQNLLAEETDDMPDDERYISAEIVDMTLLPGYLTLRVNVKSRAGDKREVILPLNITV